MSKETEIHNCAILWDLDGTLIDSTEHHWNAARTVYGKYGVDLTYEMFQSNFGKRNEDIVEKLFGPGVAVDHGDQISLEKEEMYRESIRTRGLSLLPGAEKHLKSAQAAGWKQALGTSAPRANVETVFEATGIGGYFDTIICGEDVKFGKPDPEVFLKAAIQLHVSPDHCIVVEDAPAGIEAGKRAGMKTVGVLTTHETLPADTIAKDLTELPDRFFDKILSAAAGQTSLDL